MDTYLPRCCDAELKDRLEYAGAVLVTGPKWCGKTSTCAQVAQSVIRLQDVDKRRYYQDVVGVKPSILLQGETPRLIDEWQEAPVLWDAVRMAVDERQMPGQFLLTGSSTPLDGATMHSGTGRISRLMMRPMSLFESRDSDGTVSLSDLFNGEADIAGVSKLSIERIAHLICRGGWPAAVTLASERSALRVARDYLEALVEEDIHRVDGVEKNPARVRMVLRALARNETTLATDETIMADVRANDQTITNKTLAVYTNALKRMFVVENAPSWRPSIRSKTAIRAAEKRHFVDPSIAAAALRVTPAGLLKDFESFGFLFESLCVRDLRVYAGANDGEVLHYRDASNLEVDMIVRLNDGRWAAIEVKLGAGAIDSAAKNLKSLAAKVDTGLVGEPSFLMVLTGGEYAYRREDGVLVVPLGCLKP